METMNKESQQVESFFSEISNEDEILDKELSRLLLTDISSIIDGINKIKAGREAVIDATKANFNVFTILLAAHDEVRLHTRFLTGLLDGGKNATHGCGTLFLRLFLETLDECKVEPVEQKSTTFNILLSSTDDNEFESTFNEYHTDQGNIDIIINFKDALIAIENKIWAGEQKDQLSRYSTFTDNTRKSKKYLFFLTLEGRPSESSGGKPYLRISYRDHIIPWLNRCLEKTYKYQNINSVIGQYKKVVKSLLNNTFEEEDMEKIRELIKKNPAVVKYADEIKQCADAIMKDYEKRFNASLRKLIAGFNTDTYYQNGAVVGYRIDFEENFILENYIVPTLEVASRYSSKSVSYFGLRVIDGRKLSEEFDEKMDHIRKSLHDTYPVDYYTKNNWWPAGTCYVSKCIFTPEWLYEAMSNDKFIEGQASECAENIKNYIGVIKSVYADKARNAQ